MRVALLDLQVREQMFLGSSDLASLARVLGEKGHETRVVRSVMESAPGGPAAWRAGLTELVRGGAFDLVVVTRAWDGELVDAMRAGMVADAKLVRVTDGVAAALDARFDHVVRESGLVALAGGEIPEDAAWRPSTAKELRERRKDGSALLPVVVSPEVVAQGGRVLLHGPSDGCPFLLDTRRNPVFANVPMNRDEIQTRGCSFCLDNTGAYAASSEAETVGAWIAALKAHKAANPEMREALITDERPHPYLPALVRAIQKEGLGPLELLWKSRVDWLLEFADGPVAEALTIAKPAGVVLHLYLVGFESFDQFHLDLFNKGVTVADNVRAADKVRVLAARFPETFEFRKHRAHGFVMFTPWTKPEHVIENAQAFREHRLDEFRSEVFKTRLRLYPRVPLHSMAIRDGLVADHFDESRPDRATEQGYDASVPWRFADARTEAVFEAVQKLMSRPGPRPSEADLLEIAAEFVRRWPGLAAAPEVAHLPLAHILDTKGDPYTMARSGAAALAAYDLELEGIRAGDRSVCLKENVPVGDAEGMIRALRAMGLSAGVAAKHGFVAGADAHTTGQTHCVVAVAKDDATLAQAVACFANHGKDQGPGPIREMAGLLGYPACCADAFAQSPARGDNLENERGMFRRAPSVPLHPLLQRLSRTRLISHFPCRPDCASSVAAAARVLDRMREISPTGAEWTSNQLSKSILFLDYDRKALVRGRWENGAFVLDAWDRFGDEWQGVQPKEIAAIRFTPGGLELVLKQGGTRTHGAPGAYIVEAGQPLAKESFASMQRHEPGAGERSHGSQQGQGGGGTPADADAFCKTLLGDALPLALKGGLRIESVRAPRTGGRIEVVCARDDGEPLLAAFELLRPGSQSYAKTKHMALSYRTPPQDLAADRWKPALDALRALVESREAALGADGVSSLFKPSSQGRA